MWVLYNGYRPIYDSVYNQFSNSIKHTHTGLKLAERLHAARGIAIGASFPQLHLYNLDDSSVILPVFNKKNSYTVVDFWFSHCIPCRRQFPLYKKLYDTYKNEGFQIIGISVDQTKNMKDWKKTIKDMDLDWQQYRDKDYKNADLLSIRRIPDKFFIR